MSICLDNNKAYVIRMYEDEIKPHMVLQVFDLAHIVTAVSSFIQNWDDRKLGRPYLSMHLHPYLTQEELIEMAKQNPGKTVLYKASDADDVVINDDTLKNVTGKVQKEIQRNSKATQKKIKNKQYTYIGNAKTTATETVGTKKKTIRQLRSELNIPVYNSFGILATYEDDTVIFGKISQCEIEGKYEKKLLDKDQEIVELKKMVDTIKSTMLINNQKNENQSDELKNEKDLRSKLQIKNDEIDILLNSYIAENKLLLSKNQANSKKMETDSTKDQVSTQEVKSEQEESQSGRKKVNNKDLNNESTNIVFTDILKFHQQTLARYKVISKLPDPKMFFDQFQLHERDLKDVTEKYEKFSLHVQELHKQINEEIDRIQPIRNKIYNRCHSLRI